MYVIVIALDYVGYDLLKFRFGLPGFKFDTDVDFSFALNLYVINHTNAYNINHITVLYNVLSGSYEILLPNSNCEILHITELLYQEKKLFSELCELYKELDRVISQS